MAFSEIISPCHRIHLSKFYIWATDRDNTYLDCLWIKVASHSFTCVSWKEIFCTFHFLTAIYPSDLPAFQKEWSFYPTFLIIRRCVHHWKNLEILPELNKLILGLKAPRKMEVHQSVNPQKLLFLVVVSEAFGWNQHNVVNLSLR